MTPAARRHAAAHERPRQRTGDPAVNGGLASRRRRKGGALAVALHDRLLGDGLVGLIGLVGTVGLFAIYSQGLPDRTA